MPITGSGEDTAISWSSPPTFVTGQIIGAADLNTYLRDDLNWLLNGRARIYNRTAGSYTTTSAAIVDTDGTNLAFTLNNAGTRVVVALSGQASNNTNAVQVFLYVNLDGADIQQFNIIMSGAATTSAGVVYWFTYTPVFTVAPGSHTWKLRWSTSGGTATLYGVSGQSLYMGVAEVG